MKLRHWTALTAVVVAIPLGWAIAGDLTPEIPPAKGEQCVEPTDVMRRDHMDFILHQRDETMHRGIRTEKYELEECLECHVQRGPDGEYPRFPSPQHFCNSCHVFAAVHIDCFGCHNDVPAGEESEKSGSDAPSERH